MTNCAREYLHLLNTIPAEHIGPHRTFHNPAENSQPLTRLTRQIVGEITRLDERSFAAPSPWHAAAWMMDLAAIVGQVAEVDRDTGFESPFSAKLGAPVFRGQRNPEWRLEPTLLREPRDPKDFRALELFADAAGGLFEIVAEDTRMNTRYVHLAAAQHYGLPTPYLDFTVDPRVAVYFACLDAAEAKDEQVVVYFTPFNVLSDIAGAVILPPPWVKRLYAQRGLFLDCTDVPNGVDLRDFFGRMTFPPDHEFAADVFGPSSDALLPPDPWYDCAISWARASATPKESQETVGGNVVDALKTACGEPPFMWEALMPASAKESMDQVLDMCEWLALKIVNGKWTYDCVPIQRIWQHNEPLFRNFRVIWQFLLNQFGDEAALRNNRQMLFLEAITKCVE